MKKEILTKSFAIMILALGANSQASTYPIYLSGSPAFRAYCYNVLTATPPSGIWDSTPDVATRGNNTPSKADYMLFHGHIGGVETSVSCRWSSSEAGIASVAAHVIDNDGTPFPGFPPVFLKTDGAVSYTQTANAPANYELEASSRNADLAMADTSKDVSLSSAYSLHDFGKIGIVPFTWVKNFQSSPLTAWSHLTNITHAQIKVLFGFPQIAEFFTGDPADNKYVYLIGFNKGSGTRVNALADCGYGITKPVTQFTLNGIPFSGIGNAASLAEVDNNGYDSSSDMAKALRVDGSQTTTDLLGVTGYIAVGYLGVGDAIVSSIDSTNNLGTLTVADNWLTLNGVPESDGAVESGQYSMWGNEHLYGQNGVSGYVLDFGNTFGTLVGNALGGNVRSAHSSGIKLNYMHASKETDLTVPTRL